MDVQIITVTLNPAIDHTIYVEKCGQEEVVQKEQFDIGGKGINVSKTLKKLGVHSLAMGLVGGISGEQIETGLDELEILHDFVRIHEPTRVNVKRVEASGQVVEQNAPGPLVTKEELALFTKRLLSYCKPGILVVLSGSIPRGVESNVYAELIPMIKAKGAEVFLDTSKEALRLATLAGPRYMKPNEEEFLELTGLNEIPEKHKLRDTLNQFFENGVETIIISCGKKGAWFVTKDEMFQTDSIKVEALSTVGAGDAMTAGFVAKSMQQNTSLWERARFAVAAATGAVVTSGTSPSDIETVLFYELQVNKSKFLL